MSDPLDQEFERLAKSVGLVNEHDLHRDEHGMYSMKNTRKLQMLFLQTRASTLMEIRNAKDGN
jgi:hypothetical protein